MSFWSAAATLGGALIGTVGNLFAAGRVADANRDAADIQAALAREAMQETKAAKERGIAAIRAGTEGYAATIAPLLEERPILRPWYGLTPAQEIAREDLRRQATQTVAASGLRGAGRAGVGAILDSDRRFVTRAADAADDWNYGQRVAERGRVGAARQGLAQVRAQEGGAIANTEIGAGNQLAANLINQGNVGAHLAANTGRAWGGAIASSADLMGQAFGGLASILADEQKAAEMKNRKYASQIKEPV